VILEILRQAGGVLSKTKLFQVFWLAHLYYAKTAAGYLTDWPIVRTPSGPGIDQGDSLILELIKSGQISREYQAEGPFTELTCQLTDQPLEGACSPEAIAAIRASVADVQNHPGSAVQQWGHAYLRSWRTTANGAELNIYSDLIPDDVYEERRQELLELKKAYEDLFE
jgi:hypothetical protein